MQPDKDEPLWKPLLVLGIFVLLAWGAFSLGGVFGLVCILVVGRFLLPNGRKGT